MNRVRRVLIRVSALATLLPLRTAAAQLTGDPRTSMTRATDEPAVKAAVAFVRANATMFHDGRADHQTYALLIPFADRILLAGHRIQNARVMPNHWTF